MLPFALPDLSRCPTVVLFPNVFLPLHIFEPRYRQMVAERWPAIASSAWCCCARARGRLRRRAADLRDRLLGLITHAEQLEDGKYNLVLRGLEKFTIHSEEAPAPAASIAAP
jgi:Lon protease-like protein